MSNDDAMKKWAVTETVIYYIEAPSREEAIEAVQYSDRAVLNQSSFADANQSAEPYDEQHDWPKWEEVHRDTAD